MIVRLRCMAILIAVALVHLSSAAEENLLDKLKIKDTQMEIKTDLTKETAKTQDRSKRALYYQNDLISNQERELRKILGPFGGMLGGFGEFGLGGLGGIGGLGGLGGIGFGGLGGLGGIGFGGLGGIGGLGGLGVLDYLYDPFLYDYYYDPFLYDYYLYSPFLYDYYLYPGLIADDYNPFLYDYYNYPGLVYDYLADPFLVDPAVAGNPPPLADYEYLADFATPVGGAGRAHGGVGRAHGGSNGGSGHKKGGSGHKKGGSGHKKGGSGHKKGRKFANRNKKGDVTTLGATSPGTRNLAVSPTQGIRSMYFGSMPQGFISPQQQQFTPGIPQHFAPYSSSFGQQQYTPQMRDNLNAIRAATSKGSPINSI